MMKRSSFRVIMLLALAAGSAQAEHGCGPCEGPLEAGNWFIKPKVGVAPSIFASRRARQQFVVPQAAWDAETCAASVPSCNVDNFANTLQEGPCLPKFSDMFHQGVLHVGVELGYNICDRSPWFLEFVYNRASGRCVPQCGDYITNKATNGCTKDCNTKSDCSSSCADSCCPTGDTLAAICGINENYGDYSAYGGYIGGRYFTNPFWCDSTTFFFGYKVGILHRNRVDSCSTFLFPQNARDEITDPLSCADTQEVTIKRAIFCASNSVSGGIQAGFDYCYSDCLTFQLGFEVVASCGLRGNRNHPINLDNIVNSNDVSLKNALPLPSNILIRDTGSLINFPIWVALKWEFGSLCDPCGPCA